MGQAAAAVEAARGLPAQRRGEEGLSGVEGLWAVLVGTRVTDDGLEGPQGRLSARSAAQQVESSNLLPAASTQSLKWRKKFTLTIGKLMVKIPGQRTTLK